MLVVRGPNIFAGYLGDTPAPFTEDGWLITDDLGSVAADGLVRISVKLKI
jgi:long-subunit acyl-CoA synthetase (AMP-forming)